MDLDLILIFTGITGGLLALMLTGLPIAFCFMLATIAGAIVFWGYDAGLTLYIHNLRDSVSRFVFVPLLMFILLGEVMFESGMAVKMLDAISKWLGRLPGRLALIAVAFCTLFAATSGSQLATASMMGTLLTPEMEKRGYKKSMSLGPIMGAGGLAMIIPPSNLAVLLAAIAGISVGKLLMAGYIPGLLLATLYASYIIIRCWLQPSVAPPYDVEGTPLSRKLLDTFRYVMPLGLIIFLVMGLLFMGLATPSESAVLGALGAFILAAIYKRFNWNLVKRCAMGTIHTGGMILLIIATADTFSQMLAFSGVTQQISNWVLSLQLTSVGVILLMMAILLFLGCFLDTVGMIMITMPIFMPIVIRLGIDPVWFGLMVLINMELDGLTPPVGMMLYVVKGIAPPGTTMGDVIKASLPFLACDIIAILLVLAFPQIALWLPNLMRGGG